MKLSNISEQNMNDFFRALKDFCNSKKSESFVESRYATDIDKKEIIIFEADMNNVDFSLNDNKKIRELIIPTDRMFVEIPKWKIEDKDKVMINLGGILLCENPYDNLPNSIIEARELSGAYKDNKKIIVARTFWEYYDKKSRQSYLKPITIAFIDIITNKENISDEINYVGSYWKSQTNRIRESVIGLDEQIKRDMAVIIQNIVIFILLKVEKKEYTSYKKWTPRGFETREIVYSHEVSKHKRHFWKDSGRFKIPLMKKEEWESKGYGTDEIVFRGGEIRRDVPFKIIGNYLSNNDKPKKEDNRRIKVAKGRVWRCEEKVFSILKELFPDNIIKRHDRRTLKGLELDFNLPEFRLGIEYDGEQHFDRKLCEEVFKSDFDEQIRRDRKKDKLCRRKKIKLMRIKYDEPLTKTHIKKKLKRIGII